MDKKVKREHGIISREQFEDMLSQLDEEQEKALLCLLYITGCRISEALILERKDITNEAGDIIISMPTLKTKKHIKYSYRRLPIGKDTPFLKQLISYAGGWKERIFKLNRKRAWDIIKKISQGRFTCHDFRHTRATILAGKGYSAFQIQAWFGWKSMEMAENYVKQSVVAAELVNRMKDNIL